MPVGPMDWEAEAQTHVRSLPREQLEIKLTAQERRRYAEVCLEQAKQAVAQAQLQFDRKQDRDNEALALNLSDKASGEIVPPQEEFDAIRVEYAKVEADEAGVFQGWDQRCFFQDRADDGYANSWDADATASAPVELIELWQDGVFQETSDLAPDIKDALATAVRDDVDVDGWDAQIENAEWDSISVFADRA
ncbi:hypothetical protein LTS18_002339, partial [Coniosporium uncinatum]